MKMESVKNIKENYGILFIDEFVVNCEVVAGGAVSWF